MLHVKHHTTGVLLSLCRPFRLSCISVSEIDPLIKAWPHVCAILAIDHLSMVFTETQAMLHACKHSNLSGLHVII